MTDRKGFIFDRQIKALAGISDLDKNKAGDSNWHLLEVVYRGLPFSLVGILINAAILVAAQWRVVDSVILLGWMAAILTLSAWRWHTARVFAGVQPGFDSIRSATRKALTGAYLSGVIWGLGGVLLMPVDNPVHQAIVIAVLMGIAASGAHSLATLPRASMTFLLLTLVPMVLRLASMDSVPNQALGVLLTMFLLFMMVNSYRVHSSIVGALEMRDEQRKAQHQVERFAYYDQLTELPNRRLLLHRLDKDLSRSREHGHIGGLLFIDLDRFKTINDSLGHEYGDQLLLAFARRLMPLIRSEDTLSRFGGDEFVLLLPEIGDSQDVAFEQVSRLGRDILAEAERMFTIKGHSLHLSASVGITFFPAAPGVAGTAHELLRQADVAMYHAKAEGRNCMRFFDDELLSAVQARLSGEERLHRAVEKDRLAFDVQPQLGFDGRLCGAELLVRYHDPVEGKILPDDFVPIAEDNGLILRIGDWVLREGSLKLKSWLDTGALSDDFRLAFNISPKQLEDPDFMERSLAIIDACGVDTRRIEFEVTEGILVSDFGDAERQLAGFKAAGISMAIDDFGNGHASIKYLKHLRFDTIKIDRELIKDCAAERADGVIVGAVVDLAHRLGMRVIAEGVETGSVADQLRRLGCDIIQGHYVSKPMPAEDFSAWLRAQPL